MANPPNLQDDGAGGGSGGMLAGLISFFRRAAAPTAAPPANSASAPSGLSVSGSTFNVTKKSGRGYTYDSWKNEVEAKLDRLVAAFGAQIERIQELQPNIKKLAEIDDLLVLDVLTHKQQAAGSSNIKVVTLLLNLWQKLIVILDKLENENYVLVLNTIHKIALRPEFDLTLVPVVTGEETFLKLTRTDEIEKYKRYLDYLSTTHRKIIIKLQETSVLPFTNQMIRHNNLYSAYARILTLSYFRLPGVASLMVEACQLDQAILAKLWDFDFNLDTKEAYSTPSSSPLTTQSDPIASTQLRYTKASAPAAATAATTPPRPQQPQNGQPKSQSNTTESLISSLAQIELKVTGTDPTPQSLQARSGIVSPTPAPAKVNPLSISATIPITSIRPSTPTVPLDQPFDGEELAEEEDDPTEPDDEPDGANADVEDNVTKPTLGGPLPADRPSPGSISPPLPPSNGASGQAPYSIDSILGGVTKSYTILKTSAPRPASTVLDDEKDLPPPNPSPANVPRPASPTFGAHGRSQSFSGPITGVSLAKAAGPNSTSAPVTLRAHAKQMALNPNAQAKVLSTVTLVKGPLLAESYRLGGFAKDLAYCPSLSNWPKLHLGLLKQPERTRVPIWNEEAAVGTWVMWLAKGDSLLFMLWVKEWVGHVQLMVERTFDKQTLKYEFQHNGQTQTMLDSLQWSNIFGFSAMEDALLYNLRIHERHSKVLSDCSRVVLMCDPILINFYIKCCYSRTSVYSMEQVNSMIGKLEAWLGEFEKACKKLPPKFDALYFCTGLERLIELDHHQLTAKILSLLYQFCPIFEGPIRQQVLSEFLLVKYFFHLFLHWDEMVRNYFHQLLAYRFVRIPKSMMSQSTATLGNPTGDPNAFSHERFAIDIKIDSKIKAFIRIIEDQMRGIQNPSVYFPKALEVYAPRALAEYKFYLSKVEANGATPKLMQTFLTQERKPPPVPIAQNPVLLSGAKSGVSGD